MRFYIPLNLQRDFTDSLNTLGIDAIVNFDTLNPIKVRLDKVNYRTKDGKVTASEVVFAELSSNLKMGDYLQYKNEVFLINQLKFNEFPQCYEFSTGTCNTKFDILRFEEAEYDSEGVITYPEDDYPVVQNLYCSTLVGSFEFKTSPGAIGIVPSDSISVTCQFNNNTKDIAIGDKFVWFDNYQIVSIDRSQVDLSQNYGILTFYGKKVV